MGIISDFFGCAKFQGGYFSNFPKGEWSLFSQRQGLAFQKKREDENTQMTRTYALKQFPVLNSLKTVGN